ncbi:uncharacterized protein LOC126910577 isoform X2 [Daktulosphaira vitifoliae]|uniref:uncharacterized protein LOC126910577 isoform X2 n=1 Tax=Daktulosphaira vitifoliae TaxID=58002 RepID=UPI0021A983DB|nr:uncharacterized protein LOC126910577 isoform X2 [Daktulosphaira vitifoliae]
MVSKKCQNDLFGENFVKRVKKEISLEHFMLIYGAFVTALSAIVYPYWREVISSDEGFERVLATPMRMPYMGKYATAYWPLSFLLCLAILYGNLKIIAGHCFYISTLSQIKCCFIQLKKSLCYIIENDQSINSMKKWIHCHQETLSVGNELCEIYAPMFSTFLVYFVIVNTSIMIMSMSISDLDIVMKISALSHVCMCAVMLYFSCNVGSCLTHESYTASQKAYGRSWYTSKTHTKNCFGLIIMRTNNKVECKCIIAPILTLSNETYAKFFRFSLSVFLTTRQMVERRLVI